MSCFETSVFMPSHQVLDAQIIQRVCESLGWNHRVVGQITYISTPSSKLLGLPLQEPEIRIQGNRVTYNTYYMRDGKQRVGQLQKEYERMYNEMRVEYALKAVKQEFAKRNFALLEDLNFEPNEEVKHRFDMKATSKLAGEDEPIVKIRFKILADGTLQTDSNYIPEDVHKLADEAMEALEELLGTKRDIKPKEIPQQYKHKAFCHPKTQNQIEQK